MNDLERARMNASRGLPAPLSKEAAQEKPGGKRRKFIRELLTWRMMIWKGKLFNVHGVDNASYASRIDVSEIDPETHLAKYTASNGNYEQGIHSIPFSDAIMDEITILPEEEASRGRSAMYKADHERSKI